MNCSKKNSLTYSGRKCEAFTAAAESEIASCYFLVFTYFAVHFHSYICALFWLSLYFTAFSCLLYFSVFFPYYVLLCLFCSFFFCFAHFIIHHYVLSPQLSLIIALITGLVHLMLMLSHILLTFTALSFCYCKFLDLSSLFTKLIMTYPYTDCLLLRLLALFSSYCAYCFHCACCCFHCTSYYLTCR